jgi:hypothetical protein
MRRRGGEFSRAHANVGIEEPLARPAYWLGGAFHPFENGTHQGGADRLVGPRKISNELGDTLVRGMLDGLASKLPALPPETWIGSSSDQSTLAIVT